MSWRYPSAAAISRSSKYRKAVSHYHLGAWDQWASRFRRGLSARSFRSKIVAERDGNGATVSAGQGLGADGVCVLAWATLGR